MAVEKLTRIDAVPIRYEDFTPEFNLWLTNLVDIINENYQLLDTILASFDARLTAGGL